LGEDGDYYNGSARFEATFSATSVTTRIDLNIDGTWDLSYTENGPGQIGAFTDLRVHSPATSSAGAGGIIVDNIVLEVTTAPEPTPNALLAVGGLVLLAARRRK
jgi:MYXO-CTERM domain-containing protein